MRGGWKWVFLSLVVAATPLLLGIDGCSSGSGGGLVSIDQSTEIRIGQQAAADMERQYGIIYDPVQTPRIQRIGSRIAAVSSRPNLPWSFRILHVADVNAISLPGGPIYVTRGLLALNVSDSELAGVIGHEVAHTNQRHAVTAIERAMTYQLLSGLVLGRSSQALQTAANIAIQVGVELPHSRQDEYEADAVGTRLAYNAGYPANGLLAFLQQLQTVSGPSRTPEFLRTHPVTADRIAREQQLVAQLQGAPRPVPVALSDDELKTLKALKGTDEEPAQQAAAAEPLAAPAQ